MRLPRYSPEMMRTEGGYGLSERADILQQSHTLSGPLSPSLQRLRSSLRLGLLWIDTS